MKEDILETEWAIKQQLKFIDDYYNSDKPRDEMLVSLRDLIRGHIQASGWVSWLENYQR